MKNSNEITIRKITKNEVDNLASIFGEYQRFYNTTPDPTKNKLFLKEVISSDKAIFHIASLEHNIIGFTGVYFSYSSVSATQIAIINDLFITPENRKQGIGKTLMKHTINHLKDLGISNIRWCTKEDNLEAQKFYQEFSKNKSNWIHYDI